MPFFNVNFGLDDGYAHIIENSEAFPDYFSKVILKYLFHVFFSRLIQRGSKFLTHKICFGKNISTKTITIKLFLDKISH